MNRVLMLLFTLNIFFLSCKKEDVQCTTFPCGSDNPEHYNYNRVAYDADFRIGTWANINSSVSSPDTIIFHNDLEWSDFNEYGGIINGAYKFDGIYLLSYMDYAGTVLENPLKWQTKHNDTTGVFSVLIQQQIGGYQQWGHYIKIE